MTITTKAMENYKKSSASFIPKRLWTSLLLVCALVVSSCSDSDSKKLKWVQTLNGFDFPVVASFTLENGKKKTISIPPQGRVGIDLKGKVKVVVTTKNGNFLSEHNASFGTDKHRGSNCLHIYNIAGSAAVAEEDVVYGDAVLKPRYRLLSGLVNEMICGINWPFKEPPKAISVNKYSPKFRNVGWVHYIGDGSWVTAVEAILKKSETEKDKTYMIGDVQHTYYGGKTTTRNRASRIVRAVVTHNPNNPKLGRVKSLFTKHKLAFPKPSKPTKPKDPEEFKDKPNRPLKEIPKTEWTGHAKNKITFQEVAGAEITFFPSSANNKFSLKISAKNLPENTRITVGEKQYTTKKGKYNFFNYDLHSQFGAISLLSVYQENSYKTKPLDLDLTFNVTIPGYKPLKEKVPSLNASRAISGLFRSVKNGKITFDGQPKHSDEIDTLLLAPEFGPPFVVGTGKNVWDVDLVAIFEDIKTERSKKCPIKKGSVTINFNDKKISLYNRHSGTLVEEKTIKNTDKCPAYVSFDKKTRIGEHSIALKVLNKWAKDAFSRYKTQ